MDGHDWYLSQIWRVDNIGYVTMVSSSMAKDRSDHSVDDMLFLTKAGSVERYVASVVCFLKFHQEGSRT